MFDAQPSAKRPPLYRSSFEHDNCGIGACVNIKGQKSRATVENALRIVENLEHRAGKDAEGKTGDGVGILTQVSHKFFSKVTNTLGFSIGKEREYGVGMFFFPQDELQRNQAKKMFDLWNELEERKTPEAKFARVMDNFQPVMLNAATDGRMWVENGVHLEQILKRNEKTHEGSEVLWMYMYEHFILPNVNKGRIKK